VNKLVRENDICSGRVREDEFCRVVGTIWIAATCLYRIAEIWLDPLLKYVVAVFNQ